MEKEIEDLIKKAEELDWSVECTNEEGNRVSLDFSRYSPAGQDFNFSVEGSNTKDIGIAIEEYYNSYDPSEEAYLWLDRTGHGTKGAPYDMKDVYDDMGACKDMIYELLQTLKNNPEELLTRTLEAIASQVDELNAELQEHSAVWNFLCKNYHGTPLLNLNELLENEEDMAQICSTIDLLNKKEKTLE